MIKSFRGQMASDSSDVIRLSTNNGLTGYRINKFQLISRKPNTENSESVVKVFAVKRDTINSFIDFDDPTLLAVGLWSSHSTETTYPENMTVIFDNMKFNQDIYLTHKDDGGSSQPINYYLELEQMKLDLNEATVATLKDMRGRE